MVSDLCYLPGGNPYKWPIREGSVQKGYFFQACQVYERVRISLVEGVENLSVRYEKGPTGLRNAFHDCEKVKKTFYFCDLFIFLRQCIERS